MHYKNVYLNYLLPSIATGTLVLGTLLIFFLLQPIFNSPPWVIYSVYVITTFVILYMSKFMPFILIHKKDELIFITIFGILKLKANWVDDVIINPSSFFFKPKYEYNDKFKKVVNYPNEPYMGFKTIAFYNYKALGHIIEALKPKIIMDTIEWDKMSKRHRNYLQQKLYETEDSNDNESASQ